LTTLDHRDERGRAISAGRVCVFLVQAGLCVGRKKRNAIPAILNSLSTAGTALRLFRPSSLYRNEFKQGFEPNGHGARSMPVDAFQ
jgi:hypothetical protein